VESTVQRVLVVDDDSAIRGMYETALANAGFQVTVAADGEKAILEMRERPPDVVVLDLQMPRVDGLGVLSWMRTIARIDVPVVVVTNTASSEQRAQAAGLGIAAWLVKSQTLPRQLVEVVRAPVLAS
jgi:DNA-binding response OmpR family regulator